MLIECLSCPVKNVNKPDHSNPLKRYVQLRPEMMKSPVAPTSSNHKERKKSIFLQHLQCRYLFYAPPACKSGTRPFLRWVLSQGRSPTRQAVPKMPRTPSAFPFSGRLRRRAINPTPPKRVKDWGDGHLKPEVMYPVLEHTRTNCAARNHSRSRAPHHRTKQRRKERACLSEGTL